MVGQRLFAVINFDSLTRAPRIVRETANLILTILHYIIVCCSIMKACNTHRCTISRNTHSLTKIARSLGGVPGVALVSRRAYRRALQAARHRLDRFGARSQRQRAAAWCAHAAAVDFSKSGDVRVLD
jgi:hypothetical protein